MRSTSTAVCLACAMALSSTYTLRAEDPAAIRAQITELEQELAKLKKEFACAGSGAAAASAAAASSEQYRITYLGTIMVPANQVSGASAAVVGASAQTKATAASNSNVVSFDLNQARVVSNGSRFTTRSQGGIGLDLSALTAATGRTARISIPLTSLATSGASLSGSGTASIGNQALAVRVSGAAVRAAAAKLSAAERATRMAYPNHQVVNSANFTSGIYRGTQFTAAPSTSNPFVGRYLQTPDGQLNTVMPVGQQFIVLP